MVVKRFTEVAAAAVFLFAANLFWLTASQLYSNPFFWTKLIWEGSGTPWFPLFIQLGGILALLLATATLIVIIEPDWRITKAGYALGGAAIFLFLPANIITALAGLLFFAAFTAGERSIHALFHNTITLDIWKPVARSIPVMLHYLFFCLALVVLAGGAVQIQTARITLPRELIERSLSLAAGTSTAASEAQRAREDSISTSYPARTFSGAETENESSIFRQLYGNFLIEQTRQELEVRINGILNTYRHVMPLLNSAVVFFFVGVLHLPVVYTAALLAYATVRLLLAFGLMKVRTIKMDVERLEW